MTQQREASDTRTEIRDFIRENYLYMQADVPLDDGDDLLGRGLFDSLAFVELVEHVQTRYDTAVQDLEITEDNFGSVAAIAGFIERKRAR
jgi:acyl carrier protein